MDVVLCRDKRDLARKAAAKGAEALRGKSKSHIVLATGMSQIDVLSELIAAGGIDWKGVTAFHLDEYVGIPATHPASFCKYLKERFANHVPLRTFHYIDGMAEPEAECRRLKKIISSVEMDLAFVGVGENGHLAFNDPPADFEMKEPFFIVEPDARSRRQQVGEGWFRNVDEVPRRAITMSIPQILKAKAIVCSVPERRKAEAVRAALRGPVTPQVPASILQTHPGACVFLEPESASLLEK